MLKAAESLQVKGLADITGAGGGPGATAAVTGNSKDDNGDFMGAETGGEESVPPSPPSICMEGNSDGGGSMQESPPKRKRGRPPMGNTYLCSLEQYEYCKNLLVIFLRRNEYEYVDWTYTNSD